MIKFELVAKPDCHCCYWSRIPQPGRVRALARGTSWARGNPLYSAKQNEKSVKNRFQDGHNIMYALQCYVVQRAAARCRNIMHNIKSYRVCLQVCWIISFPN